MNFFLSLFLLFFFLKTRPSTLPPSRRNAVNQTKSREESNQFHINFDSFIRSWFEVDNSDRFSDRYRQWYAGGGFLNWLSTFQCRSVINCSISGHSNWMFCDIFQLVLIIIVIVFVSVDFPRFLFIKESQVVYPTVSSLRRTIELIPNKMNQHLNRTWTKGNLR